MPDKISRLARNATLRQLQVFESIVRHQSFTKAAEELHLTQPTVSMQVKKLVDTLEAPLFEQIGRKVYLTETGKVIHEATEAILNSLSRAEQRINHLKGFSGGTVKMSVITTAQYFIPKVIKKFSELYPDVTIVMRVSNKENLLERILTNKDDFYLLGQPPEDLNVVATPLAANPLAFVANANHPLVGKRLHVNDLQDEPFLMREQGSGIRAHVDKIFDEFRFSPKIKMMLGSNEAIRLGLLQDLGITVTSIPTIMEEISRQELAILDVSGFPINRHWYLAYPSGKILSIAAEKFIEILHQESKQSSLSALNQLHSSH